MISGEQCTWTIFRFGDKGAVNYDIQAERGTDSVLIELKYLKKSNDQRIIRDLIKLALPSRDHNYHRLFLIAFDSEKVVSELMRKFERSRRSIFRTGFGSEGKGGSEVAVQADFGEGFRDQAFSSYRAKAKEWLNWKSVHDDSGLSFTVECIGTQTEGSERVTALMVDRVPSESLGQCVRI